MLNTYYIPGTVLGTEITARSQTDEVSALIIYLLQNLICYSEKLEPIQESRTCQWYERSECPWRCFRGRLD